MPGLPVILVFCASLLFCVAFGYPVTLALFAGFLLFMGYGLKKGIAWRELWAAAAGGFRSTVPIVVVLCLIGMFTASWRASGTIAYLVSWAIRFVTPEAALLMAFLLNAMLSTITGTSFGTAATMGVICMTMTDAMGISPVLAGGAVLSGIYVGDRCSPVSTSASLVCLVTQTDIYRNVKYMLISGMVPLLLSCAVYAGLGFFLHASGTVMDIGSLFAREFSITWITLLPAAVLVVLVALRTNTRLTLAASTAAAAAIAFFVQDMPAAGIVRMLITGFAAHDQELGRMLNGGGVLSMAGVCLLVLISSTYAGIFEKTGLLSVFKDKMPSLADRLTPFGAIALTAFSVSTVLCNQFLAVMLTREICSGIEPDKQRMANALENSAVIIPAMFPWAVACAVPLATLKVPALCVVFACFLYLVPLWGIVRGIAERKEQQANSRSRV